MEGNAFSELFVLISKKLRLNKPHKLK